MTIAQCTAMHTSHSDTAHVWVVVKTGDEHLWCTLQHFWFGDILDNGIHQCGQVFGWLLPIGGHPAVLCRTIERLEVELLLCGIEVAHEVEYLLLHLVGAAVEFIDFVDDYDRFEVEFQRLLQHEARLWHRTFEGIHEQQHAVCHVQYALHLTAEIGVARSVNYIDFVALVFNRYILCQDGDTALALEFVVIEDEFALLLVVAEEVGGVQHLVHERCFAVVHVCDDSYVSDFLHNLVC